MPYFYFPKTTTLTDTTVLQKGWQFITPAQMSMVPGISTELVRQQAVVHGKDLDLGILAGLTDPNADRIVFWDDSASAFAFLAPGSNLSITGTTLNVTGLSTLASGTYTPTLFNTTNVSASTSIQGQYMRVGSVVTVSGKVSVTESGLGDTTLGISLPIASNIGGTYDCCGTAARDTSTNSPGVFIKGDAANDRATMQYYSPVSGAAHDYYFTFTYQII